VLKVWFNDLTETTQQPTAMKGMKMKTKIYETNQGTVVVSYDDTITGERLTREFMVPANGGYVREWVRGDWKQICDGLSNRGDTLHLNKSGNLLGVIRSEYRAMRRNEKQIFG
jgi:hypothetical protein